MSRLVDSHQQVPEPNKQAIKNLIAKGFLYTFATGRNEQSVMPYIKMLEVNAPVILYNGARIVDFKQQKVIFERFLSKDNVKLILNFISSFRVYPTIHIGGRIYVDTINSAIREYITKDGVSCIEVGVLTSFIESLSCSEKPIKILIIGSEDVLDYLYLFIQKEFPTVSVVRSEPMYLEILPTGITKGAVLPFLCNYIGIKPEEVVAIGDGLNDITLIEAAGLGVAVENAVPALKERADFISRSDEECGVAEVIHRFFLADRIG